MERVLNYTHARQNLKAVMDTVIEGAPSGRDSLPPAAPAQQRWSPNTGSRDA